MKLRFLNSKEKTKAKLLLRTYNPPEFDHNDGNITALMKSDFHNEIPLSTGPYFFSNSFQILLLAARQTLRNTQNKTDTDTRKIQLEMLMSALTATVLTGMCMLTAEDEGLK